MRLSKLGIFLGSLSIALTLAAIIAMYAYHTSSHGASEWLMFYATLWNLPFSLILFLFPTTGVPDWIPSLLIVILGGIQWYLIGWAIEALVRRLRSESHGK
mgnify:CR=1 FL=1